MRDSHFKTCMLKTHKGFLNLDWRIFFDPATRTLRAKLNWAFADRRKISDVGFRNGVNTLFQGLLGIIEFEDDTWEFFYTKNLLLKFGYFEGDFHRKSKDRARVDWGSPKGMAKSGPSGIYNGVRRIPHGNNGVKQRFAKN